MIEKEDWIFLLLLVVPFFVMGFLLSMILLLTGCTVNFQNISTNGKASDIVDENQKVDSDVSPDFTIPLTP